MNKLCIGALAGIVVAFATSRVSADCATEADIRSLSQKGQDVTLEIEVYCVNMSGCVSEKVACEVTRDGPQGTATVTDGVVITNTEPVSSGTFCCDDTMGDCGDDAGPGYDCDGDSVPECCDPCFPIERYEVVDTCVPPGMTTYTLRAVRYGDEQVDTEGIDVKDEGAPCLKDDQGGSSGCSMVGVGAPAGEGGLPFLMLLVGAIGVLVSRRRV
ncbi:MAG: hypothetical protein PHU25_05960 [Deltaproteobacteria bacterium]|nr:hypothetical protein [Deltaproteobacteria bacterium]